MLSKGYLYHLVGVNDLEHEVPSLDIVPIVVIEFNDFLKAKLILVLT